MSLFTRLPVTNNDASLPILSASDVRWLSGLEENAYEHWIFDDGDATSLVGKVNNISLTPQSVSPTYNDTSVSLSTAVGEALMTGITGAEILGSGGFTAFIVTKIPVGAGGNPRCLFGNYEDSAVGFMIDLSNFSSPNYNANFRGDGITMPSETVAVSGWYFIAISGDVSTNTTRLFVTPVKSEEVSGFSPDEVTGEIGIGNAFYDAGGVSTAEYAEAGIIKTPYNMNQLEALYNRSKGRMSDRGIVVA